VNAVTAIGQDGVITVTAHQAEKSVVVSVGDTGPGIPKERLEKIFDPLFTTKPDGTGLGLSIGAGILKKLAGQFRSRAKLERALSLPWRSRQASVPGGVELCDLIDKVTGQPRLRIPLPSPFTKGEAFLCVGLPLFCKEGEGRFCCVEGDNS